MAVSPVFLRVKWKNLVTALVDFMCLEHNASRLPVMKARLMNRARRARIYKYRYNMSVTLQLYQHSYVFISLPSVSMTKLR